jgi:hypothetical protein
MAMCDIAIVHLGELLIYDLDMINQLPRNRDKVKDDAIAQLSDHQDYKKLPIS